MSSLYLYFFKQYKNIWKNLSLRIRIEIIILFIIYFAFFTTRLIQIITEQLSNPGTTEFGLNQFILHILLFLISFSIPFIHLNLLQGQKGLVYYRTLPLNRLNTFWLLFFLHYKYQLVGLLAILPLFIALLAATNIFLSVYFFVGVILYQIILILYISHLATHAKSKIIVLIKYFLFILIVFSGFFLLYYYSEYYILFDPVFFTASSIYLIPKWKINCFMWDSYINISNQKSIQKNKVRLFTYSAFQMFPFPKISPLLAKEMLNYLRNRRYIRVQMFSFIIYGLILLLLNAKMHEDFVLYSAALTIIFIWQHSSLRFNEKYIKADSAAFIKTLPFKYYQLWIAKFVSEFIFVFIIIMFLVILYVFMGFHLVDVYQSLFAILLFSLIVLSTIINFKIIFFDSPRFAGYVYHFFIVFVSVMSFNYYLVGPIITLILLIYFTYYSYREFAR